jgi:hypothetical protein
MRALPNSHRVSIDHITNMASARQILQNKTDKDVDEYSRKDATDWQSEVYGLVREGSALSGELEHGLMSIVTNSHIQPLAPHAKQGKPHSPMHAWAAPDVGGSFVLDDNMTDVLSQESSSLRIQLQQLRNELDLERMITSNGYPAVGRGWNLGKAISPIRKGNVYNSDEDDEADDDDAGELLSRKDIKQRSSLCLMLCADVSADVGGPVSMAIEPLDVQAGCGEECPCT